MGQLCVTKAFTYGQPARISVVGLLQIVFALGLDLLIDGSSIQPTTFAGIALVLAPIAWMMLGSSRKQEIQNPRAAPERSPVTVR